MKQAPWASLDKVVILMTFLRFLPVLAVLLLGFGGLWPAAANDVWCCLPDCAGACGAACPDCSGGSCVLPPTAALEPTAPTTDELTPLATCELITPLGPAQSVDWDWGAIPSGLSSVFPQQDGAFLGLSWGVGSLVPYLGSVASRCCGPSGCSICDATSCRLDGTRGG